MKTASSSAEGNLNEQSRLDTFLYYVGLSFGITWFIAGLLIIILLATSDFANAFPKD
jgi:hypothetical protein